MLVLKDVLRPRLRPISSGGERVPTRQVPYRQQQILSKSHMYLCHAIVQADGRGLHLCLVSQGLVH